MPKIQNKRHYEKGSLCEEIQQTFSYFPEHHLKIFEENSMKIEREIRYIQTKVRNEGLHEKH
jgi:hypothetical protein